MQRQRLNIAYLVLGEFGLPSSANDGEIVGLSQHLYYSDTGIEIYRHLSHESPKD